MTSCAFLRKSKKTYVVHIWERQRGTYDAVTTDPSSKLQMRIPDVQSTAAGIGVCLCGWFSMSFFCNHAASPSVWPLTSSDERRSIGNTALTADVSLYVFLGGVCGRDSFGARFRGPNGSHRWHSSQALPTDQVAVHRAPLDHRSLPIPELVPTFLGQSDGPLLLHTHTHTFSLASPSLHADPGRTAY